MEAHLDQTQFHGFVSGTLTVEERDAALLHLDTCARCRKILSALASDPDEDEPHLDGHMTGDETIDLRKVRGSTELVPPLVTPKKIGRAHV
jgi:hypothetical protein